MPRVVSALLVCNLFAIVAPAPAQTARDTRLIITVTDPSGGVVPNAIVTVVGLDGAMNGAATTPLTTSQTGAVTFEGLAAGRYSVRAEFSGFGTGLLKEVRLRVGDNRHIVVLPLKNMQDSVTVVQDAQAAAVDPRGTSFRTMLTREDIEALSDDPAEMAQQLQDIAGGNAVFRIDSFVGGALPPKPMIKSIHIVRDTFSAENHSAESDEIQIITQPGVGPLRGTGISRVRDGSMSGQSPFTSVKGPERTQNYQGSVGGTLVERKASFSLSGGVTRSYDTPIVNVALPNGGAYSDILPLRRPADAWTTYDLLDYAITRDQALRVGYNQTNNFRDNLGVGGYDVAERAYSSRVHDHELRIQEAGPVGRRVFSATRLEINWTDTAAHASVEAPTIRVLDGFTRGGAQVRGGRRARAFEFGSDLDYIRGIHSIRLGMLVEGGHYRSDDETNYLGTYTFNSVAAFEAGQPALFVRRIGSPIVDYWNVNSGAYIQDDIRFKKSLTFSPGLRYEVQTHVRNAGNVNPRFGVTWAPFKSGRTTLRSSYGVFNNWVSTSVYEQTLRVDGFHQLDVSVVDPPYPATAPGGVTAAPNRYLFGGDVQLVRTQRVSAGIDQALTPRVRLGFIYSHVSGAHVLRGENLNAPVNGQRQDTAFANEIQVVSDGALRTNQLQTNLTVNLAPAGRGSGGTVNWRRTNFRVSYTIAKADNDSDGAFSVPPSGTLATEWGPAPNDRRRRWAASINSQAVRNLTATLSLEGGAGTPYSVTTGYDNNGDLIFNDRPLGVGRNTERTATQNTWRANFTYAVAVGPTSAAGKRYRLAWTVNALNPMNHANYTGYSGVMTSLFFRQPTAVQNPRKVDLSMSFGF
jgi:hypothetical protein